MTQVVTITDRFRFAEFCIASLVIKSRNDGAHPSLEDIRSLHVRVKDQGDAEAPPFVPIIIFRNSSNHENCEGDIPLSY